MDELNNYPCCNHSGDQDSVIPLTGSRKLVHGLAEELGLIATTPYRAWFAGMQVISLLMEKIQDIMHCGK